MVIRNTKSYPMASVTDLRREIPEKRSHAARDGLICAFVVAVCLWASYPVAQIGIDDEWSYIKTAQLFAQTGHFVYNGWAAMMLGWQVVWAALFIKLFGFSFTVVRLSVLPVAMATVALFHAILLRFGINPRNAVLGALTLGLSPLFVPMAVTYMSDVPGLFALILCLYLCQRAVAAGSSNATIGWLCLAAATNVVGGTVRQIAWLGALVMVPSTGWLLRKRRGVMWTALLLWVFSVAGIFACMRWYARQPYSVPEFLLHGYNYFHGNLGSNVFHFLFQMLGATLCLLLLVYPILAAWLPEARRLDRGALVRIASALVVWGVFQWITGWTMPWLSKVLRAEFAASRMDPTLPPAPFFLPIWGRALVSLLIIAPALVLVERGGLWSMLENKSPKDLWLLARVRKVQPESRQMLWLLGPFALTYFVLLLPRAYHLIVFDRYLLPILPIAIICMLRLYQRWIAPTLPTLSVVVLAVFALFSVAGTHDWFAWSRARVAAIDEVRVSGVARTDIQGGFEYDGWTETEASGHINNPLMAVPAGEHPPDIHPQPAADQCRFDFAPYTPAIHPRYTIVFPKMPCLAPSKYPPVSYRTWLPPFQGAIYIQTVPEHSN